MIKALLTIDDVSSENTPAIVDYLCEYSDKLSLDEVKKKQKKGLKDWA